MTVAVVIVGVLAAICLWRIEDLAYLFGANEVIFTVCIRLFTRIINIWNDIRFRKYFKHIYSK